MKENYVEMPRIKWSIIKTAPAYNNISKRCTLCLQEKLHIIEFPDQKNLLNRRSELVSKCRHTNKYLLKNFKNKKKGRKNTENRGLHLTSKNNDDIPLPTEATIM